MEKTENSLINHGNETGKISITNAKIGERFKYSNSLGHAIGKTADTLLWKLKKKHQLKNSRTLSDKNISIYHSSPNLFEIISPRNEKWQIVQDALTNALLGKPIANLTEVLCNVRQLDEQCVTNAIVDFYEAQVLKNTLQKLQMRITTVQDIQDRWIEFFRKSLPNVILILSSLKTQLDYVERITLFEFKRRLTKVDDLKKRIIKKKEEKTMDWSIIQNMFLVLQSTTRNDNEVTEIDVQFEEAASLLVSPLIGYRGVYIKGELVYENKSLSILKITTDSASNRVIKKARTSLSEIFGESKSVLDISGKF